MRVASRISSSCCVSLGVAGFALLLAAIPQTGPAQQPKQKAAQANVLKLPGQILAYEQTPLYSKMTGFVKDIKVDIGDRVKKDQLLVELYVPEVEAELRRKEALAVAAHAEIKHAQNVVKQTQAEVAKATAQIKEAEAGVKVARTKLDIAKNNLERGRKLLEAKAISREEWADLSGQMDAAMAMLEQAQSKILTAKETRTCAGAGVDAAQAKVEVAEAHREVSKADVQHWRDWLHYAKITAPYDGIVVQRDAHVGHFLATASSGSSSKQPSLLTVVRVDKMRVVAEVPEADAMRVKVGAAANIEVKALGGKEFKGTITRTSWALDEEQRTVRVEVDLPNADGELRPGMFANVAITLGSK